MSIVAKVAVGIVAVLAVLALFLIALLPMVGGGYYDGPTRSIADSKALGVFVGSVRASPSIVDLGDTTYEIHEAWVEHQFRGEPFGLASGTKAISRELTLCLNLVPIARNNQLARTAVRVKDAHSGERYGHEEWSVVNLHSDFGLALPHAVILRCDTRDKEVTVAVTPEPNKALQPTAMSVTPRAEPRVAPAIAVADL